MDSDEEDAIPLELPKRPEDWLRIAAKAMRQHHSSFLIAPLDMSCAFSVSDARQDDMPLIYASPAFETTTQYRLSEVQGKNHRFMQDPKGQQDAGAYREHTDNTAVRIMMEDLSLGQESQVTLSNYLKSSKRWTNVVTMIPILSKHAPTYDFVVALQINADMFPNNITRYSNGAFEVDYRLTPKIARPLKPPPPSRSSHSLVVDDLLSRGDGDRRLWSRFLLREVRDVVFVLSTQGMIMYVSPSVSSLLGYTPRKLKGQHISFLAHPADLPSITKALDNAVHNYPLTLLARLRHSDRSYQWIEFAGQCLQSIATFDERCVVVSARARRTLASGEYGGEITHNEFWSRTSTDGLILFSTASSSKLLGIPLTHLLGARLSDIVDEADHESLSQALELARSGIAGSIRHSCVQKYPQFGKRLPCVSYFFPGTQNTASPDFLLVRTYLMLEPGESLKRKTMSISPTGSPSPSILSDAGSVDSSMEQISLAPISVPDLFNDISSSKHTSWQTEFVRARKTNKILRERLEALRTMRAKAPAVVRMPDENVLRCTMCGTTETTQWRTGVQGVRLCNSCGLSWRKRAR